MNQNNNPNEIEELDSLLSQSSNSSPLLDNDNDLLDLQPEQPLNQPQQSNSTKPTKPKKSKNKHKIWIGILSGVSALSITAATIFAVKAFSTSSSQPDTKTYKVNINQPQHCSISIQGEITQAKPNDKITIIASNIEVGYRLLCASINKSSYIVFDSENKAEFTMPACDVAIDVFCEEIPPTPPEPEKTHTVIFDAGEGGQLIGSNYSIVQEGEYFGWINKPIAYKEDGSESFVCWTDEEGNKISNLREITQDMKVYASYVKSTDEVYSYLPAVGYFTINNPYTTDPSIDITIETELNESKVVSIPKDQFDCPIYFGSKITEIKDGFLQDCTNFNQPINIGQNITKIGKSFLKGCINFNSTIDISDSVIEIVNSQDVSEGFLSGCSNFNQLLKLPNKLETIPNGFLFGCSNFNQVITIPSSVTTIGKSFLQDCYSFNQNLLLPPTITTILDDFMFNTNAMTSTISIQFLPTNFVITDKTLSTENETALSYTTGITIGGSYGELLRAKCNNRTTTPFRKINSFTDTCFVTFFSNGGGQIIEESIQVVKAGTLFKDLTPPKVRPDSGFSFDKWTFSDGSDIPQDYSIDGDVFIKANFIDNVRNVEFYASEHGTISGPCKQEVKKGTLFKELTKPEIYPDANYVFDGYYRNNEKIDVQTPITDNCKIEVRFKNKPVNVKIKINMGTDRGKEVIKTAECNKDFTVVLICTSSETFPYGPIRFKITSAGKSLILNQDYKTSPETFPSESRVKKFEVTLTVKSSAFSEDIIIEKLNTAGGANIYGVK